MHKKELPDDTAKEVGEWLGTFEEYKLKEHPGDSVQWGYQLTSSDDTILEIYQPLNRVDHILITIKVDLTSTLINLLEQLTDASKAQLYFELQTEMFRSECQIQLRHRERTLVGLHVAMPVFADALSQDILFYRIQKVSNAKGLLMAIVNRAALNYPKRAALL